MADSSSVRGSSAKHSKHHPNHTPKSHKPKHHKPSHPPRSSSSPISVGSAGGPSSTATLTSTSVTTKAGGVTTVVTTFTSQITVSATTPPISVAAPLCVNKGFNYCLAGVEQELSKKCGRGNYACYCRKCNSGVRNCVGIGCSNEQHAQEYIAAVNSQCSQGYGIPSAVNTAPLKSFSSSSGSSLSAGAIAGIVIGVLVLLILVLLACCLLLRRKRRGKAKFKLQRKDDNTEKSEGVEKKAGGQQVPARPQELDEQPRSELQGSRVPPRRAVAE